MKKIFLALILFPSIAICMSGKKRLQTEHPAYVAKRRIAPSFKELMAMRPTLLSHVIQIFPELAHVKDEDNNTLLHFGAYHKRTDLIDIGFAYHVDIAAANNSQTTALHYCAWNNNKAILERILIAYQAQSSASDDAQETDYNDACMASNPINAINSACRTPFFLAAAGNHIECMQKLIDAGAYIDAIDNSGHNALHFAASRGHTRAIQLLLQHRSDPNAPNITGMTPLHMAAYFNQPQVIELLVAAGANLDAMSEMGRPLYIALMKNHREAAIKLLELETIALEKITSTIEF